MAAVTGMGRADRPASHAEAALYERHSSRIFGYCLSRLGAREDAEDATQLTFLHAVRGLRRGVVPAAESAWLFGIARNVCLSRWASAARRSRVESACDPTELERRSATRDPSRDELIGLERALELLPDQQRRAVLLRDWRGLSYEEVAEQLGVSTAAVETLIFRGRAALAEHLSAEPRESRRRLHSLGSVSSLLDAVKSAFGGAAAGAKVTVAVGAAVAVSGGVAIGTTVTRAPAAKPAQPVPQAVRGAVAEPARPAPAKARSSAPVARTKGAVATPVGQVAPRPTDRPGETAAPAAVSPAEDKGAPSAAPRTAAAPAPAPTPAPAPRTEGEAVPAAGAEAPTPGPATAVAATPEVAPAPVATPVAAETPVEAPAPPPIGVPALDEAVAAVEPAVTTVTTVVTDAVAAVPVPEAPKAPEVPVVTAPKLAPVPTVPVTVPSLP